MRRAREVRERTMRENLNRIVELRRSAVVDALQRVEAAAAHGRSLQAQTIHRCAQSAEHRYHGIGRHVERVSHYCASLADRFGPHSESLGLASVLHDVGKHATPDTILLKEGSPPTSAWPCKTTARWATRCCADRDHGAAWPVESAIAWMIGERGKHFDPEVLDAFVCLIGDGSALAADGCLTQCV